MLCHRNGFLFFLNPLKTLPSFVFKGTTWTLNILRQILYANNPEMIKLAKLLDHPVFAYMEFGNGRFLL